MEERTTSEKKSVLSISGAVSKLRGSKNSDADQDKKENSYSYNNTYKYIKNYAKGTFDLLDEMVNHSNVMYDNIQSYFKKLNEEPTQLSDKRAKSGIFTKVKGPKQIDGMDTQFTEIWERFAQTVINDEAMMNFSDDLKNGIAERIITVREFYKSNTDYIFTTGHTSRVEYKKTVNAYQKSKAKTAQLVKQIEDTKRKIAELTAKGESQDSIDKLIDKKNELKEQFPSLQADEVQTLKEVNDLREGFVYIMDMSIHVFEQADKQLLDDIQVVLQFQLPIKQYLERRVEHMKKLVALVQEMKGTTSFDEFYESENLGPMGIHDVAFNPPKLPFNMFEFLPGTRVFGKEIEKYGAVVKKEFIAKKNNEISLQPGEVVIVKKKGMFKTLKVIKVDDNREGYIKSDIIDPIPSMKRKLLVMNEDFSDADGVFSVIKGEVVMAITIDEKAKTAVCINAYSQKSNIPLGITGPYKGK